MSNFVMPGSVRLRAALLLILGACGGGGETRAADSSTRPAPGPAVASVDVMARMTTLVAGDTLHVLSLVRDANGRQITDRKVVWQSSSDAIATMSPTGTLSAKSPGTATITATADGKSASVEITVEAPREVVNLFGPASIAVGKSVRIPVSYPRSAVVAWAVNDIKGGNATFGTIDSTGYYTAPSRVPPKNPVRITLTFGARPDPSGVAMLTVVPR